MKTAVLIPCYNEAKSIRSVVEDFRKNLPDAVGETEPLQSRDGQHDRIVLALVKLPEPRIDISAKIEHFKIGARAKELRPTAKTRRTDPRAFRQFLKRRKAVRHQGIPRIKPLRDCRYNETVRHLRRHILQAVHGEIYAAGQHFFFQFLREKPLAADLRQRHVENPVPLCRYALLRDGKPRIFLSKPLLYIIGLPKRQLTPPRTDDDLILHRVFPPLLNNRA